MRRPVVPRPSPLRAARRLPRPSGNRPRVSAGRPFDRPLSGLLSPRVPTGIEMPTSPNSFRTGPDERGHFGLFGGRYVAETLMPLILELEQAYAEAKNDPRFRREMEGHLKDYVGRPTPLYFAERLTEHLRAAGASNGGAGGAKIYLKREDLNHTGAHKVNNVLGQIL